MLRKRVLKNQLEQAEKNMRAVEMPAIITSVFSDHQQQDVW
jgi:hypothetical protein